MPRCLPWVVLLVVTACSGKSSSDKPAGDKPPLAPNKPGAVAPAATSDEPASPPTSESLIDQGVRDGKLDAKTAALYSLLDRYSPGRIPDPYWAPTRSTSLPSVTTEMTVRQHLSEYGPVEAAAARAMLASPDDDEWLRFPAGMPLHHAAADSLGACFDQFFTKGDSDNYKILKGQPIETNYFSIQTLLPHTATVKDMDAIKRRVKDALARPVPGFGGKGSLPFGDYIDSVVDNFATMFKNSHPRALPAGAKRLGKIPIWVVTCDGFNNDAGANPYGEIMVSVGLAFEDDLLRRVVLPHEIFHLVEYGYTAVAPPEASWIYEAAAVAMEDEIAPDVKRWSGQYAGVNKTNRAPAMDRMFKCPEEPLHIALVGGPCSHRGTAATTRYRSDYSRFIAFKYVMKRFSRTMESLWDEITKEKGDARKLKVFDPENIGAMQVELVAQRADHAYIDPADRALFVLPGGKESLDFTTTNANNRYTYKLDVAALEGTAGRRVIPSEASSQAALTKFDSSSLPIEPGATHRWLIKVPASATNGQEFPAVSLVGESTPEGGAVRVNIGTVGDVGGAPGRDIDFSINAQLDGGKKFPSLVEFQARPEYLLASVTNTSTTDHLTYKVAVSLPGTCADECAKDWLDWWNSKSCADGMCSTAEGADKGKCIKDWKDKEFLKKMGLGIPQQWCGWVCWKDLGTQLDKPFLPAFFEHGDGADHLIRSAGVTRDTKLGFIPLKEWPLSQAVCTDYACNDTKGGNCKKNH